MSKITIPIQLRWSDLDAFGHVNNVQVARILEEARVRAFWKDELEENPLPTAVLDSGPTASTWTLIARQEIEYLKPMPYYKDAILVEAWFSKIGGASITVNYEIYPPLAVDREVYYRAQTTLVLVDSVSHKPRKLSDDERKVFEAFLGEEIQFRRS